MHPYFLCREPSRPSRTSNKTPPGLRRKPRPLSSPLRSPGSSRAWVLTLVPLETKLRERRDRVAFTLHLLFRTHGLGTGKGSQISPGDRTSELSPARTAQGPRGRRSRVVRQPALEASASGRRRTRRSPGSLLSAARGPGAAQACRAAGDTSLAPGVQRPSNFFKTRQTPTTSAGPRGRRARSGKGRPGGQ